MTQHEYSDEEIQAFIERIMLRVIRMQPPSAEIGLQLCRAVIETGALCGNSLAKAALRYAARDAIKQEIDSYTRVV